MNKDLLEMYASLVIATQEIQDEDIKKLAEGILVLVKNYDNQTKEIERLNNKVEELMTLYTTERNVKEDYKAIIKEVREHIENNKYWNGDNWNCLHCENILEILDKVGDEK